jgi:hypothetical protein
VGGERRRVRILWGESAGVWLRKRQAHTTTTHALSPHSLSPHLVGVLGVDDDRLGVLDRLGEEVLHLLALDLVLGVRVILDPRVHLGDLRVDVVELAGAGVRQLLLGDDLEGGEDLVLGLWRGGAGEGTGVVWSERRTTAKKKGEMRRHPQSVSPSPSPSPSTPPPTLSLTSFFSWCGSGSSLGSSTSGFMMSTFSIRSRSIWWKSGMTCEEIRENEERAG